MTTEKQLYNIFYNVHSLLRAEADRHWWRKSTRESAIITVNAAKAELAKAELLLGIKPNEAPQPQLHLPNVSGSFSQKDMENFAAKCMILGHGGKTTKELLQDFCDNDR